MSDATKVERTSERELVLTRTFNGPPRILFDCWSKPELMQQWWAPKSMGMPLVSCEMDVRVGGGYRFEFRLPDGQPLAFFGKYLEVVPAARLVWTNEESPDGAVTTVTFEDRDGKTLLTLSELYPTKAALDEAISGMADGMPEQFAQLDELLVTLT